MKKWIILAIALVLALAVFAAGCTDSDDAATTTDDDGTTVASSDPINVGANFELSGPVATYGQDSLDGFKMAIDEANAAGGVLGGRKIFVIEKDNRSDPAEATAAAEVLMTQNDVVLSVGPATSGNFRAVIPVAMENQIPVISSSATADDDITVDTSGNVRDFVFRTCFTDSFQGKIMANFAAEALDAKTAVIYADNASDYAKGLAANFRAAFEAGGGTIVDEQAYVAGDKDFNAVLTALKAKDFDVIFVPGYYQEAGLIIKQARELGIDAPILGADGFDSPELATIAGAGNVNDVFFSNHYSELDDAPETQAFIKMFQDANNGESPNAFIAMGYDLGKFVVDAITRAGSDDPVQIAQALAATTDFTGVTGSFSVGDDHNVIKAAVVIELQNGEQVSAKRF
jgi:branched-chain amino acid transport system substrate-binding protein